VIEVSGLTKRYGETVAVDQLNFEVRAGEVVGFLGPNGAGKTTTLRILTGFLAPTSGVVKIGGHDVTEAPLLARELLGYLPETCPLYPELRVEEYLAFRAQLKHVPRSKRRSAVSDAMQLAGISDRRGSLIGQLSKGLKQRVGLADALVSDPPLLILDEPSSGLDPNQIREVRKLLLDLKERHTVVLSTHILKEVEMVCDRAIVLSRGRVVAEGSLEDLRRLRRQARAELVLDTPSREDLAMILADVCRVLERSTRAGFEYLDVELLDPEAGLAPALERLVGKGVRVREARLAHTSLEEVFVELTQDDAPDPADVE
jgi:ABC-2 type transport system ATP-binding protein